MAVTPNPLPDEIATARQRASQTQVQAGAAVGANERTWQDWERGQRTMPTAAWWLYLLRVGHITLADLPEIPERQRAASS